MKRHLPDDSVVLGSLDDDGVTCPVAGVTLLQNNVPIGAVVGVFSGRKANPTPSISVREVVADEVVAGERVARRTVCLCCVTRREGVAAQQVLPIRDRPTMMRVAAAAGTVVAHVVIELEVVGHGAYLALIPEAVNPAQQAVGVSASSRPHLGVTLAVGASSPDVAAALVLNPAEVARASGVRRNAAGVPWGKVTDHGTNIAAEDGAGNGVSWCSGYPYKGRR